MARAQTNHLRVSWVALAIAGLLASAALPAAAKPKGRKQAAPVPDAPERAADPPAEPAPPDPPASQPTEPAAASVTPLTESPPSAAGEPEPTAQRGAAAQQLASLSSELTALMDDLVQARARAAVVGKTLWKTLIRVNVQNLAEDEASLGKLVLKLDGAAIFRGDGSSLRGDSSHQVFEGFVAPGPHVLHAEVEQSSRAHSGYGYALRETYRLQALRDKRTELTLVLSDDSDVASEAADEQDGEYDIRTRLRVRTKELSDE